jgi:hypothetical protein
MRTRVFAANKALGWLRDLGIRFKAFAMVRNPDLAGHGTEALAEELANRIKDMPGNPMHDVFYRHGFHLLRKHFYVPIPDDTDQLDEFWQKPSDLSGLDMNDATALDLMDRVLPPYLAEFRDRFPIQKPAVFSGFWLINGGYMAVDAHVLYALVRHNRPKRVIEIGAGNSTLLTTAAIEKNVAEGANATKFASIDPYPWDMYKTPYPFLTEMMVKRIQDVPVSLFEELGDGDILFIDSSHVIRSGNDCHYEYLEILPRLKAGVLVHVHDISLPLPYPRTYFDNQLYWNEQYLLQAFLIYNYRFEVIWPGNYMMLNYPERMMARFPEIATMRERYPQSEPSAFWMRVKATGS